MLLRCVAYSRQSGAAVRWRPRSSSARRGGGGGRRGGGPRRRRGLLHEERARRHRKHADLACGAARVACGVSALLERWPSEPHAPSSRATRSDGCAPTESQYLERRGRARQRASAAQQQRPAGLGLALRAARQARSAAPGPSGARKRTLSGQSSTPRACSRPCLRAARSEAAHASSGRCSSELRAASPPRAKLQPRRPGLVCARLPRRAHLESGRSGQQPRCAAHRAGCGCPRRRCGRTAGCAARSAPGGCAPASRREERRVF